MSTKKLMTNIVSCYKQGITASMSDENFAPLREFVGDALEAAVRYWKDLL